MSFLIALIIGFGVALVGTAFFLGVEIGIRRAFDKATSGLVLKFILALGVGVAMIRAALAAGGVS